MYKSTISRSIAALLPFVLATGSMAQGGASACFVSLDFETIDQFSGWGIGNFVETQTPDGVGLGELVPAWEVMNAVEANAEGYFPVRDQPMGNRFVAANDAASPCNCDMNDVALTTPTFDLTGRTGVALQCRIFNDGTFGSGPAILESDLGDGVWMLIDTLPVAAGQWQPLFIDLSAYDDQAAFRLRFRWSDGGGWASGFAFDDFCLRTRFENDLSVVNVQPNDATVSPFTTGDQSLRYHQLPLEQAGPMTVVAHVLNAGTATLYNVIVSSSFMQGGSTVGPLTDVMVDSLTPGERASVRIATGHIPDALGTLEALISAVADGVDGNEDDNSGGASIQITGPGWDNGYSTMSVDDGLSLGAYGDTTDFVLVNRMEIIRPGSTAEGINVLLGAGTTVGEEVRAILFRGNLTFLDTSLRHTVTQQDIDNALIGSPLYLALAARPSLVVGDVFVGIQHLVTGDNGTMEVALGGDVPFGASALLEGITFDVTYLHNAPMVRLHLGEVGVGLVEVDPRSELDVRVYPNPATTEIRVQLGLPSPIRTRALVLDALGRTVMELELGIVQPGSGPVLLSVSHLPSGPYTLALVGNGVARYARFHVIH